MFTISRLAIACGLMAGVGLEFSAGVVAAERTDPWIPVGAAKLDVTPSGPVRLTGYGNRRKESEGVAQRIWAKALAIGSDDVPGPVVWIMLDNCGMTPAIRQHVVEGIGKQTGIPPDRVAISVTHTHTAPCLTNWAPYIFGEDLPAEHQRHVDEYTRDVTDKLMSVARMALANRRPARLSWGVGKVDFAANRRVIQDSSWKNFGVQPDGPVDHSLPVLVAQDAQGHLLACVANYACHCTTLGGDFNQISGDWAGSAQAAMEADHPGCIALTTIGCGADANPHPRRDDLALVDEHGRKVADEVKRLLATELRPVRGPIRCKLQYIDLPFAGPRSENEWTERSRRDGADGYHARKFLSQLQQGEAPPTSLSYPVGAWTFGDDLAIVLLGGEVVVDYAVRLRQEFDASRLWITAYTNDVPCYIPSRRILREGGYEPDTSMTYYARPQQFSPEVEDRLVDAVQKILPHAYYGEKLRSDFPPPRTPEESLAAIHVLDGWKVDLVAAEPLVEDPVAFDWGPDGRLWVVEMRDYPNGVTWEQPGDPLGVPGGRIKILEDRDSDGRYDHATLFWDQIPFPCGVKVWRHGALIVAAPDIWYAEDTDQDGRADHHEKIVSGFTEGNPQHRANGLVWGIDNWLYVANGDSGGKVRSVRSGQEVAIGGRDLRVRPDQGTIQSQSGQTQFGRCRDAWNHWFGNANANPLWHYVLEEPYLARNVHLQPPDMRHEVPEIPGAAPVFPASRTLARFNDLHTANRFTSACSPEIYGDVVLQSLLGASWQHAFMCEPVHNLVHHEILTPDGISFRSRRAESEREREFFASEDNWCRPVVVRTGPDGAIWIADMYRQVLEHPEWIPLAWQRKLELRAGSDRGRIYRVTRADESRIPPIPRLDQLDTAGLVAKLQHPNSWQRDMAQQMLLWRNDSAATPALESMARQSDEALARLHAIYSLEGLGTLSDELVLRGLRDEHPEVRRHAIRLAEPRMDHSSRIAQAVSRLAADPVATVRMQVAYSLGEWQSLEAGSVLASLARSDGNDQYVRAAILSSTNADNLPDLASSVLAQSAPDLFLDQLLDIALGFANHDVVNRLVTARLDQAQALTRPDQWSAVMEVSKVLRQQGGSSKPQLDDAVKRRLAAVADEARTILDPRHADASERTMAVALLGSQLDSTPDDAARLGKLLSPRQPLELQQEVVQSLARGFPQWLAAQTLPKWPSHPPAIRQQVLDALLAHSETALEFITEVERGHVPKEDIDARTRQRLLLHGDDSIRHKAEALFAGATSTSRSEVVEEYLPDVLAGGDIEQGRAVFDRRCATCHRLEGIGQAVGPELTALGDRSPRTMLTAILDPNAAVETKYLEYIAQTQDGLQVSGFIANETGGSVTLAGPDGKQATIRRRDIETLQSTGKSLMPEGMEADLSSQDLANVIAFVRSVAMPAKVFAGNHPDLAHVWDNGSIRLAALNAKIYGPQLVFEDTYRNLGYWLSADDHAVWTMNVPRAGTYHVILDYACDDQSAGNRYVISVGDQVVSGIVSGTGSWDRYGQSFAGSMKLEAGLAELMMRSEGPLPSALMDLRQIILQPQ